MHLALMDNTVGILQSQMLFSGNSLDAYFSPISNMDTLQTITSLIIM